MNKGSYVFFYFKFMLQTINSTWSWRTQCVLRYFTSVYNLQFYLFLSSSCKFLCKIVVGQDNIQAQCQERCLRLSLKVFLCHWRGPGENVEQMVFLENLDPRYCHLKFTQRHTHKLNKNTSHVAHVQFLWTKLTSLSVFMLLSYLQGDEGPPGPRGPPGERVSLFL